MPRTLRVAVDVGGTFTDICVLDEASGAIGVAKVPSTADPIDGVLAGVEQAGVDLADVALFSHGTTVATNALITRRLPKAAMVTTRGLPRRDRDPPRHEGRPVGRLQGRRPAVHHAPRPARGHRAHRLRGRGRRAARRGRGARRRGAARAAATSTTVAVCFVNAYANPAHEQRMGEILAEELPGRARLDVERGAARDLRARALLDHGRERRAVAAGRRVRRRLERAPHATAATTATC